MFGRELDFRVQPETQWGYPLHLSNVPCALSLPPSLSPLLCPSLSRCLSLLPQMEVSGMRCVLFLQITFMESGGGEGFGGYGVGVGVRNRFPQSSA